MTPRPTLSQKDLLALLNWELAAYQECAGCRFVSLRDMASPDDTGCNWFDARVASDHRVGVGQHFIVRQVIEETRREFDLRPH
jgi:hypothetical protein